MVVLGTLVMTPFAEGSMLNFRPQYPTGHGETYFEEMK
jgi:hypothetical protein